jgi:hypothetical protein
LHLYRLTAWTPFIVTYVIKPVSDVSPPSTEGIRM